VSGFGSHNIPPADPGIIFVALAADFSTCFQGQRGIMTKIISKCLLLLGCKIFPAPLKCRWAIACWS
jgi:hypothetical protein